LSDELASNPYNASVYTRQCWTGPLTVWALGRFWVERASRLNTVVLLHFSNIAAHNPIMFFGKAGRDSELMQPSLPPEVLFSDPTALDEITLAFLYTSTMWVVKMSLPPQDFPVGVSAGMSNDASGQEDGGQSLRKLDHDDRLWNSLNLGRASKRLYEAIHRPYYTFCLCSSLALLPYARYALRLRHLFLATPITQAI
jgi:hypothetical protein